MLKISAQIGENYLGTAEELADHVSGKLLELGFTNRHRATERLVRFYTYENILSKPERANDDRRKANYGDRQVRQLLLARVLAERGVDLEQIRNLLKDHADLDKLNGLIDKYAQPSEAEKLFFRTSPSELAHPSARAVFSRPRAPRIANDEERSDMAFSMEEAPSYSQRKRFAQDTHLQLREVSDSAAPAMVFRKMVVKESMRPDLDPEVRDLYKQLLAFHPAARGEEPKRERWTRLRLAHWCEASFHIDNRGRPSEDELEDIVNKFRKALRDSYLS